MIINVRVDNFLVYSNEVELSLLADMRIKKFTDNVYKKNNFNILKSACVYGVNNSGKTCLIRAINSIVNVLLGSPAEVTTNIFRKDRLCSLGITFMEADRVFSYDFKFDNVIVNGSKKGFVYECLKEIFIDKHKNISEKEVFVRDAINNIYRFNGDKLLGETLSLVSNANILIYTINTDKYTKIDEYKTILRNFASKVSILSMDNIPIEKTINVLKNNESIKEKTIELIKMADLDIEDYLYATHVADESKSDMEESTPPSEAVLKIRTSIEDMLRLTSVHKGKLVRSLTFDSTGTKKMVAAASYIVDALENGKILVVDELDSSLHFKLTRSIVALFNNELNKNAQLLFTAHDATLLDCKKLFRKDQIWFTSKDESSEYLYSLADFTASEDGVRSDTDLFNKYNAGVFGAVPEPDLISILLTDVHGSGGN